MVSCPFTAYQITDFLNVFLNLNDYLRELLFLPHFNSSVFGTINIQNEGYPGFALGYEVLQEKCKCW